MKLIDILVEELPKLGGWPEDVGAITQDSDRSINNYRTADGLETNEYGTWRYSSAWQCYLFSHDDVSSLADDYTTAIITREQYESALAAKDDGWIEWGGGECPVPCGTIVDVKHRCGAVSGNQQAWPKHHKESDVVVNPFSNAGQAFWRHENSVVDIIAYRLHQPKKSEQVRADAWNAYAGITKAGDEADLNECIGQDSSTAWSVRWLPSAGCECEYQYKVHGSEWCSFECVAVDGNAAFGWSNKTPIALQLNTHNFRQLRTEAERKRDEAIEEMIKIATMYTTKSLGLGLAFNSIYNFIAAGEIPGVKLED